MNLFGIKKTTILYLIIHILSQGLFMLADFIEEKYNESIFLPIGFLGIPIILFVFYLIFQFAFKQYKEQYGKKMIYNLLWFSIGTIISIIVCYLIFELDFPVHQARGGWENFLNGIEYMILGLMLNVVNTASFIIIDTSVLIYNCIKNKNKSME